MADALNSVLWLGTPYPTGSLSNFVLNQDTDQIEWIFQVPPEWGGSDPITRVGFRHGTTTGTSPTYKASLQGVNADGNPDGTIKGGGSPASKTFSPSSLSWAANTWQWLTLDNSYQPSPGEFLSLVIAHDSGTVDGSNNTSFSARLSSGIHAFPCVITNDNGSRTRQTTPAVFGFGTAGKAYGFPVQSLSGNGFHSGGSPNEWGIRFSFPADWGATYKVAGLVFGGSFTANGTSIFTLYSGSDTTPANSTGAVSEKTVQQQISVDHDVQTASSNHVFMFAESSLATLHFGATYRIAIAPQEAVNVTLLSFAVGSAGDFDSWMLGQNVQRTQRTGSGDWTDTSTNRPAFGVILADIAEPSGGGIVKRAGFGGGLVG